MLLSSGMQLIRGKTVFGLAVLGMKRSKGEGSYTTLDEALKNGKLSRQDFFDICRDLEKNVSYSNRRFLELCDLILNQRFQKEEEYKKRVGFRT